MSHAVAVRRSSLLLLAVTIAAYLGPGRVVAQGLAPDPLEGIWEGSYVCPQGETAASVALSKVDTRGGTRGIFTFGSLPGFSNARAGSYTIFGVFEGDMQRLVAVPAGWIEEPENYVQVGFTVSLDPSGQTLRGRVDFEGCASIVLHRRAVS